VDRRLNRLRSVAVRAGFAAGRLVPVRRQIVLATSHAKAISGNLAWIRLGLELHHPEVRVVIEASRPCAGVRGLVTGGLAALRSGWRLATSRLVVVDDYFFPMYAVRPRAGTRYVQVWHACGAFKRFGYGAVDRGFGADEATLVARPIHINYDLCLVSAMRFAPFYAQAFRQPVERFTARLGIPRTDLFFDEGRQATAIATVRHRYAIPSGARVVLYAPTFRGTRTTHARSPEGLDMLALRDVLGDDHVILVRSHPFVTTGSRSPGSRSPDSRLRGSGTRNGDAFAIDVSDWPDINELMLISDVLVTDYSSSMYEFALLGRPIAFLAPDHAAYEAERGFYLRFPDDLPGPSFERSEELAAYLRAAVFDLARVRRFASASFDVADGKATTRFIEQVVLPALR
jgi:teichoic acid ribitol-phosphate primase